MTTDTHPARPWSLPPPPAGRAWHRDDWTEDMLPKGYRPLLRGEAFITGEGGDEYETLGRGFYWQVRAPHEWDQTRCRTRRPLPPPLVFEDTKTGQKETFLDHTKPPIIVPSPDPKGEAGKAKAKEATAGAKNPLFTDPITFAYQAKVDGKTMQVTGSVGRQLLSHTDPKGEAGKAKAPLYLLPPEAMRQAAWAHSLGAKKYGPANWRGNKVKASTYISAMMRHIAAYLDGEDHDSETSAHAGQPISHLANVIASANILLDAKANGTLEDDRPPRRPELNPLCPD